MKGLINRLVGSHESTEESFTPAVAQGKLSYDKFPGLTRLIEESFNQALPALEQQDSTSKQTPTSGEALFPLLDLLRRGPPPLPFRAKVRDMVFVTTSSSQWHVRELASRTLVSCFDDAASGIAYLRSAISKATASSNATHGLLLSLRNVGELVLSDYQASKSDGEFYDA